MRSTYLISYFQPKLGYQQFFLAKEMQKMVHQVSVITSNYYFPFPDYQNTVGKVLGERKRETGISKEEGVTVYRLPLLIQFGNSAITMLKGLKKAFLKLKPDIIYSYSVFTPLAFRVVIFKKFTHAKLFFIITHRHLIPNEETICLRKFPLG